MKLRRSVETRCGVRKIPVNDPDDSQHGSLDVAVLSNANKRLIAISIWIGHR